jgi:hypothetical protein
MFMNAMTCDMKATLKWRKMMENEYNAEMHLHFTLLDAVELAHQIGYTEWMELFQDAFIRMKPSTPRELSPEEKQRQLDLLNDWEL